jgi:hypothetical protein
MNNEGKQFIRDNFLGQEVSAILLIRDYIEIQFDGPNLQFMATPYLLKDNIAYRFPHGESLHKFRELIGSSLLHVLHERNKFEFHFSNSSIVECVEEGGTGFETFFANATPQGSDKSICWDF